MKYKKIPSLSGQKAKEKYEVILHSNTNTQ